MRQTPRARLRLAAALLLGLTAGAAPAARSAGADAKLSRLEADLHRNVNAVRTRHGLVPLRRDAALDAVARAHSEDMASRGYLAHENPEGLDAAGRLRKAGRSGFSLAGENVGLTNRPSANREILSGWLTSPVHRRNLLAPVFNAAGLGIARAADGTLYYTQLYVTYPR